MNDESNDRFAALIVEMDRLKESQYLYPPTISQPQRKSINNVMFLTNSVTLDPGGFFHAPITGISIQNVVMASYTSGSHTIPLTAVIQNSSVIPNAVEVLIKGDSNAAVDYIIFLTTKKTVIGATNFLIGHPTISIASPAVISLANHGLSAGNSVVFSTTGALPTGISAGATYYVISSGLGTNSFEVSSTPGGSAVNASGSQSGTHSIYLKT